MSTTKQMQERAKAMKKAAAFREELKVKEAGAKLFKEQHPEAWFVQVVHVDVKKVECRKMAGWVVPEAGKLTKDQCLEVLCEGFMRDMHITKQQPLLFKALAGYLPLLNAFQAGMVVGHDGISIQLFSDGERISCRQCLTGPSAYIVDQNARDAVLDKEDGVDVQAH